MSSVIYTATQQIAIGHTAGLTYFLDFPASALDDESRAVIKTNLSIGGNPQTIVDRVEERHSIATNLIPYSQKPYWDEFRWSVIGNQFVIDTDPLSTNAAPVNQQPCVVDKMPQIQRVNRDYFRVSMSVRIV